MLGQASHEIRQQHLSAAKARTMLGWRPLYSLEEGISRTVTWYKNHLCQAQDCESIVETEPVCRVCGASGLKAVLSLGHTPLANALLEAEQLAKPEPCYPLDLAFCPRCSLVQITETVPPEKLFREYAYFSSFSDTMLQHARDLTRAVDA